MSDYELQISIKNAPLLNLMRKNGITNLSQLAKLADVSYVQLCKLSNLKMTIYTSKGELRKVPAKLSDFFNVMPEELAPEQQHHSALTRNKVALQLKAEQMFALTQQTEVDPIALLNEGQIQDEAMELINSLNERQKTVITKRFFEQKTLREIGKELGVQQERIRQIESRALDHLRQKAKQKGLDDIRSLLQ